MSIKIRNQRPATLYNDPFSVLPTINANKSIDDFNQDVDTHVRDTYVKPMFAPLQANTPVVIEDDTDPNNVQPIDEDTLFNGIKHLWTSSTLDVNLQDQVNEIYRQGIQYHQQNDWYFEEQLGVEAITRMKLPVPTQRAGRLVRYSASVDVIPAAKTLLAQNDATSAINWFANICAYTHDRPFNNYLLLTVQSAQVFTDIKQQVQNFVQMWQAQQPLDPDVVALLADFDKIDIANDLSAGLFLPNGGGNSHKEQEALSFTRILMYAMAEYEANSPNGSLTVQPVNLSQLYKPENIVIINLENYAHATATEIRNDWDTLEQAMNAKQMLRFISNKKLMTAKSISRSMNTPSMSSSAMSKGRAAERSKVRPFSGTPIPAKRMLSMMKHVIESQITSKVTENTYKSQSITYMRPNRRSPDDINLPGKLTKINYRPDIHIYLDTSGSISESQYRDAVTNLIMLTKKINCNLYLTSFSHYVSQTSLLKTKDMSTQNIYQQFLGTPKVTGGTDFEQVWRKIDLIDEHGKRSNKSHQINFIITDFGYSLSRGHKWSRDQASVKNTYYIPISMSKREWKYLRDYALSFAKQMTKAGDYAVRRRMLM